LVDTQYKKYTPYDRILRIMTQLAITTTSPTLAPAAQSLAERLQLVFYPDKNDPGAQRTDYLLVLTEHFLGLQKTGDMRSKPFYIDFLSAQLQFRTAQAGLRKERLARAIGIHPKDNPVIIDATAGLGRDSFILASLGYHITMLEKSSIIHALLADALARAQQLPGSVAAQRLQLVHADACDWLPANTTITKPDVIYIDPMFPEKKKSASAKKDMVILHNLLGYDDNVKRLTDTCLTCAGKRVVVKRPRLAPSATDYAPNFSMTGNSTRFDIYLV
jgi:16S rRNA (guanine1516-N2)-methyltransferase